MCYSSLHWFWLNHCQYTVNKINSLKKEKKNNQIKENNVVLFCRDVTIQ